MAGSRTLTAIAGLLASLAISVAAWVYFDALFLFLLVPFVPLLLRGRGRKERPTARECPECGFRTRDPDVAYCPYDGTELASTDAETGRAGSNGHEI